MSQLLWTIHINSDKYRIFKSKKPVENLIELINVFKIGETFGELWQPIDMELFNGDEMEVEKEVSKPVGDFIHGVVAEAVCAKAKRVLEPIIMKDVEFLPLKTDSGMYYELNVKHVNCLDVSNSIVQRFPSSGRIMKVAKYRFFEDELKGINIFRIPELRTSLTFVSDIFKSTVENNNLTGLIFNRVPVSE